MTLATKSAQYLWRLSKLQQNPVLKSNYYLRLEQEYNNEKYIFEVLDCKKRCSKCLIEYSQSKDHHRIQPEQKLSRFARKMLHKRSLTKFQTKYLKKIKKNLNTNTMQISCTYCKQTSNSRMKKPIKDTVYEDVVVIKRKPKKQHRDKFCGLNEAAVMSLKPKQNICVNVPCQPDSIKNVVNIVDGCNNKFAEKQLKQQVVTNKKKLKRLQNIVKKDDKKVGNTEKSKNQSSYNQNIKGLQNFLSMLR